MNFIVLILAAIIIEGLITYIKGFIIDGKFQWQMLVSLSIGIFVSTVYGVDLFALVGIQSVVAVPWLATGIGCVLTGILISRGSNYIFDLISTLTQAAQRKGAVKR